MTVRELREMLFHMNQDAIVTVKDKGWAGYRVAQRAVIGHAGERTWENGPHGPLYIDEWHNADCGEQKPVLVIE